MILIKTDRRTEETIYNQWVTFYRFYRFFYRNFWNREKPSSTFTSSFGGVFDPPKEVKLGVFRFYRFFGFLLKGKPKKEPIEVPIEMRCLGSVILKRFFMRFAKTGKIRHNAAKDENLSTL